MIDKDTKAKVIAIFTACSDAVDEVIQKRREDEKKTGSCSSIKLFEYEKNEFADLRVVISGVVVNNERKSLITFYDDDVKVESYVLTDKDSWEYDKAEVASLIAERRNIVNRNDALSVINEYLLRRS